MGLPSLLLISLDGLRWNYLSKLPKSKLPNMHRFIENGVHVKWIENVFPTVTRPNHMSMVSGLYAEKHGIVQNDFYDPALEENMAIPGTLTENDCKWVDTGAEPIWVTNSKAGEGRRSGCILWPCAEARIKGMLPDKIVPGEWTVSLKEMDARQRIDRALDWLTAGEDSVNFVAVYFNDPDDTSHKYGPDSQETLDAILACDEAVGYLTEQVAEKGLSETLNVIITADHGMVTGYPETNINIDRLLDRDWHTPVPRLTYPEAMVNIWPKEGCYEKVLRGLQHVNLHVETKDSLELQALHYSANGRIAPIVIYAEEGWMISNDSSKSVKGLHGYDPRYCTNMYPFFIASGPAFRKGVRDAAPFHIVDIYSLMCHVLRLTPAPNDGRLENVTHILAAK